jgi:hypothetical protein
MGDELSLFAPVSRILSDARFAFRRCPSRIRAPASIRV